MDKSSDTRAAALLHHRSQTLSPSDPIALPLTSSATFHTPDLANLTHVYGRSGMPTWEAVEAQLALLEEADTVAFPSGMAAINATLVAALGAGKTLMLPSDENGDGIITQTRFSAPIASHASAATSVESIPPLKPRTAFLNPFLAA